MHCEEDLYKGKGGQETSVKLSAIPVTKRDISVATAPSTHGTNEVKDAKQ